MGLALLPKFMIFRLLCCFRTYDEPPKKRVIRLLYVLFVELSVFLKANPLFLSYPPPVGIVPSNWYTVGAISGTEQSAVFQGRKR